jgi:hypothetical protein
VIAPDLFGVTHLARFVGSTVMPKDIFVVPLYHSGFAHHCACWLQCFDRDQLPGASLALQLIAPLNTYNGYCKAWIKCVFVSIAII